MSDVLQSKSNVGANVAVAAAGAFIALLALLHLLSPEFDPSWRYVSEYETGRFGWMMVLAFFAMAGACFAGSFSLWPRARATGRVGLAFVMLAGIGALIGALFLSDSSTVGPENATTRGRIHEVGAMLGSALPMGAALATWSVRKDPAWRGRRLWLLAATLATWASMIAFSASLRSSSRPTAGALDQKSRQAGRTAS